MSMISEQIERLRQYARFCRTTNPSWSAEMLRAADTIEALSEKAIDSDWISVKDELPPTEDPVLVCTQSKNGCQNTDKGYFADGRWVRRGCARVTHWMPLPELPEPESEDK